MPRKLLATFLVITSILSLGGVANAAPKQPSLSIYCKLVKLTRTATNPAILTGNGLCNLPVEYQKAAPLNLGLIERSSQGAVKWAILTGWAPGTIGKEFNNSTGSFQLPELLVPNMPDVAITARWSVLVVVGGIPVSNGQFVLPALNLLVTSPITASGVALQKFHFKLSAKLGLAPYTWSQVGGKMPHGLKLTASGVISGTPILPGTYQVILMVSTAHHKASTAFPETIVIKRPPGYAS